MAVVLVMAVQARASLFDITFSDGAANTGSGNLTATPEGGGLYLATGGSFTINAGGGLPQGAYSLLGNPNYLGNSSSPSGYFYYDNQLSSPAQPYLDLAGLLFLGNGLELNLYGNGLGQPYTLYANNGFNVIGSVTLTAVPEPTTIISGVLLLLPFGASTLRILRKRQVA